MREQCRQMKKREREKKEQVKKASGERKRKYNGNNVFDAFKEKKKVKIYQIDSDISNRINDGNGMRIIEMEIH